MTALPVTIAAIVAAMTVLALVEAAVPLHTRGPAHRAHLAPNLTLTALAFATHACLNAGVVLALATSRQGLLHAVPLPPLAAGAIAVVALDLSFYVAHRAMHAWPALWRFHCVHHADPAVDVTTTLRQHPVEALVRSAALVAVGVGIGASPAAFAVYRVWSALHGLLEHANVRTPRRLDALLSLVVTTPSTHKVHHSRRAAETNTNYANVFALFDRVGGTFTPSAHGVRIAYGLDGFDDPGMHSTAALLAVPFRPRRVAARAAAHV